MANPSGPREIVLITKNEPAPAGRYDWIERVSKILAIAAIPVVLAAGGWWVQRQIGNQAIRRDYVQLAVTILSQPDSLRNSALNDWAIDLLAENAPTPLPDSLKAQLRSGETFLPIISNPTDSGLRLNVRAGPGADQPVVAQISESTPVVVEGCRNGWCRIQSGDIQGYVAEPFLGHLNQ